MNDVSVEQARRIAVRAQLLDGSATGVLETVAPARLPPDRPDLDGRAAAVPRPLEPARAHTTAPSSIACSGRSGSWSSGTRSSTRSRTCRCSWRAPGADVRTTRANAGSTAFLKENAAFRRYVLRELERRGPLLSREIEDHPTVPPGTAQLVGRAQDGADAGDAQRPRRGRRRRPAAGAAGVGSRRALVSGGRSASRGERRSGSWTSSASARSASGSSAAGCSRTRTLSTARYRRGA